MTACSLVALEPNMPLEHQQKTCISFLNKNSMLHIPWKISGFKKVQQQHTWIWEGAISYHRISFSRKLSSWSRRLSFKSWRLSFRCWRVSFRGRRISSRRWRLFSRRWKLCIIREKGIISWDLNFVNFLLHLHQNRKTKRKYWHWLLEIKGLHHSWDSSKMKWSNYRVNFR